MRSRPLGLISRRRASQVSRAACSSADRAGAFDERRLVRAEVHDHVVALRLTPIVRRRRCAVASVTSASAVYCCHSSTPAELLVGSAQGLRDAADRLLDDDAVLER